MTNIKSFLLFVDTINEWMGRVVGFVIIAISVITVLEVMLRYIFNRPTLWAWDVNLMLMGAFTILPGGYLLLKEGHVIVDIYVARLSPRRRAMLDLATSVLFFISVGFLLWQSIIAAFDSLSKREIINSVWGPPLYPLKMLWPVGPLLLLLQGMAKFIRDLAVACSKEVNSR